MVNFVLSIFHHNFFLKLEEGEGGKDFGSGHDSATN